MTTAHVATWQMGVEIIDQDSEILRTLTKWHHAASCDPNQSYRVPMTRQQIESLMRSLHLEIAKAATQAVCEWISLADSLLGTLRLLDGAIGNCRCTGADRQQHSDQTCELMWTSELRQSVTALGKQFFDMKAGAA